MYVLGRYGTYGNDCYFYFRIDMERPRVKWWRKGNLLVDSYKQELLSDKIILYHNGSLQVRHVQQEDSGEYVCQMIRPVPWGHVTQIREIEVMCKYASVTIYTEISVLSLYCVPIGNPSLYIPRQIGTSKGYSPKVSYSCIQIECLFIYLLSAIIYLLI